MRWLVQVIALLPLALLETQSLNAADPPAADASTIVFSLRRWDGEYETNGTVTPSTAAIYSVRSDGSPPRQLVAIEGAICDSPAFSPDGKWLYFQSNASGEFHLYRCQADGSARQQLTSADKPGTPWKQVFGLQIAPGGQVIGTAHDGRTGCVVLLSPDGSKIDLVAPQLGYLYMSDLTARGDALVVSGPASGYRLWLLKLPAALDRAYAAPDVKLVPDDPESFAPQFTPDGRTIIYTRRDGDVYRVQSDGSGARRLTEGNGYDGFRLSAKDRHGSTDGPQLSPDGKQIAFIAARDGVPNVWAIDLDGSKLRQLTRRTTPCGRPRFSPDGRQLAFVSFEGKYPQLFIIPAAGGDPRQLTDLAGAVYTLSWQP